VPDEAFIAAALVETLSTSSQGPRKTARRGSPWLQIGSWEIGGG
jgi:hypothetical protein